MRRPFLIRSSIALMGVAAGLSLAACTSTENSNGNIEGTLSAAFNFLSSGLQNLASTTVQDIFLFFSILAANFISSSLAP